MDTRMESASFGAILIFTSLWMGCQNQEGPGSATAASQNGNHSSKCTADSAPVCGQDGKTYLNACAAWDIGKAEVAHAGACTVAEPVKDPQLCHKPPQGPAIDPLPAVDPTPAGGVFSATCKDPSPRDLGIAIKCTNDSDPVCGCDNVTYTNACQAAGIGGVNVLHKGACGLIK